jgi:hypothetical protein
MSGAGEPHAALDNHGWSLAGSALLISLRQGTRRSTSALSPRSLGLCLDSRSGSENTARVAPSTGGLPLPRAWTSLAYAQR